MVVKNKSRGFLERLLANTGGSYVTYSIISSVIGASIGMLLGLVSEQLNVNYSSNISTILIKVNLIGITALFIILIIVGLFLSQNIRLQLESWKKNPELNKNKKTDQAWKDSHNIIWRYALIAIILFFGMIIVPKALLLKESGLATRDQVIYSIIAGIISSFAFVPLSTIILDRLMVPVRKILLPNNFSQQFAGLSHIRILYKTLALVIFSLFITALLIAPIGYHQTTRFLYGDAPSQNVLLNLQIQSILASSLAILFATGLALLLVKSISDPMASLMAAFKQVEQGDLTTRASVVSSDEISQLAIYFNRMVSRLQELQSDLEGKVIERTSQLKAINEVGKVATSILDPDELIERVVNLITEQFGYYYSAIYLLDDTGQWAELTEATGGAGQVLKESKHRVEVSNLNIIGRTIRSRKAQAVLDVREPSIKYGIPILPYTRSELVLPLFLGDQVLGALDVHSSHASAFNEQDIETLQNMANQVAISLDNARLFQETRQSLYELRNIQKQYLQRAWIDSDLPEGEMSLTIGEDSTSDDIRSIEFPITLREQIIGHLKLEGEEELSPEDKNFVQAITTQTALALENARLLNESQSAAIKEKFVSEITNKIWSSTSFEGVLQTTVRELGQILDATEATIELKVEE